MGRVVCDNDEREHKSKKAEFAHVKREITDGEESRSSFSSDVTTSSTASTEVSSISTDSELSSNAADSTQKPVGSEARALAVNRAGISIFHDDSYFQAWRAKTFGSAPPGASIRPEQMRCYVKYGLLPKPPKEPKVKKNPVKYKPRWTSPFREPDLQGPVPIRAQDPEQGRSTSSNNNKPKPDPPVASRRRSQVAVGSPVMTPCVVRLQRVDDDNSLFKNGAIKARVSPQQQEQGNLPAQSQRSGLKRPGPVPALFEDEEEVPPSFKNRKTKTQPERPRKVFSSYGRMICKPPTYGENGNKSRPSKKSVKEVRKGNISNVKSVRRALFDSPGSSTVPRAPTLIEVTDDFEDTVVECPEPFHYSSDFSPPSPFAAREFDKENYLERYIRPGPTHPDIKPVMVRAIARANARAPEAKIISKYTLTFKQEHLARYDHMKWLDDPNIDFYLEMIRERSNNKPGLPRVYVFHCFFYKLFNKSGYDAIKETTAKDDIFTCDLAFFPVIIRDHWRLIVADFRDRTLKCYDSMFRSNDKSLEKVKDYLVREYREKHGPDLKDNATQLTRILSTTMELSPVSDTDSPEGPGPIFPLVNTNLNSQSEPAPYLFSDWDLDCVSPDDIPQQKNGSDCGIFLCQYAEYLSRDVKPPFDFNQRNMPYFRVRMAYETITGHLLQPVTPAVINRPNSTVNVTSALTAPPKTSSPSAETGD